MPGAACRDPQGRHVGCMVQLTTVTGGVLLTFLRSNLLMDRNTRRPDATKACTWGGRVEAKAVSPSASGTGCSCTAGYSTCQGRRVLYANRLQRTPDNRHSCLQQEADLSGNSPALQPLEGLVEDAWAHASLSAAGSGCWRQDNGSHKLCRLGRQALPGLHATI